MAYTEILIALGSLIVGVLVGHFVIKQTRVDEHSARAKAEKKTKASAEESLQIVANAREHVVARRKDFELEQQHFAEQIARTEKLLESKQASLERKEAKNAEILKTIKEEEQALAAMKGQVTEVEKATIDGLTRAAGVSFDAAKRELLDGYEKELRDESEIRIQRETEWALDTSVRDAKNILSESMYKYAESATGESEHAAVTVSRDEAKGRIVGRGGRMIAFFEELFNVDVVFNDEPNTILVGCFNLVTRETARVALERLIRERTITEDVIRRVKVLAEQDVAKLLQKEGEAALKILGLTNMPPDFAKLVGRLKFRTSYGQNIMRHCFEVGYFARMIASEVGADVQTAWLGGSFHDIGKAIDQEVGGSHDVLSKEILEKYGFSWEIVHAAWTHHNAIPQETIEAHIVQAADAISASRPGARAESMERYIAKIKELQATALSFDGVKKAFAINAGRELRVIVDSDRVNDQGAADLANTIAAKVQEKGGYPGKIKVMTIRVTKATDYAKK